MEREQVFSLIRAHLAEELEDSYGVKISDEEAAKIQTVGQAVDFVLASGVHRSASASRGRAPE